jgi:uncharacterized protein
VTTRFGLKEAVIKRICGVLVRYPQVDKAILYGSRAKGDHKHGSDIDLTLMGDEGLSQQTLYKIMNELDDLLLPYTIDLSIFRDISDRDVIEHIRRVGIAFYEKKDRGTSEQ